MSEKDFFAALMKKIGGKVPEEQLRELATARTKARAEDRIHALDQQIGTLLKNDRIDLKSVNLLARRGRKISAMLGDTRMEKIFSVYHATTARGLRPIER